MKFSAASFIITDDCNLRCKYCFTKKCNSVMNIHIAMDAIDFLCKGAKDNMEDQISITLFGGEPTLYPELMKEILEYAIERTKRDNLGLKVQLITNCTIFSEKLEDFLLYWKKEMGAINVQLSLEGIQELQNRNRPTSIGEDSSWMTEKTIKKYLAFASKYDIKFGEEIHAHMVVSKLSLPHIFDSYLYFLKQGFPGAWFFSLHEEDWAEEDAALYKEQLMKIADYIIEKNDVNLFNHLSHFNNCPAGHPEHNCMAGITFCTITPDGDVYACHRLYNEMPEEKIGSIYNISKSKKQEYEDIKAASFIGTKRCMECESTGCFRCLAVNMKHNLLPNLCMPKHCMMSEVETSVRSYLTSHFSHQDVKTTKGITTDSLVEELTKIFAPLNSAIDEIRSDSVAIEKRLENIERMLVAIPPVLKSMADLNVQAIKLMTEGKK